MLNSFIVSFIVGNREGRVLHRFLNSGVRRDKRTVNSLLLSMQLPLINVNSLTQPQIPGRLGGRVSRPVGRTMSGLGLGDMGEVERTAGLFVQRRDAGPPGGSGPGSPDKNITCVYLCMCVYKDVGKHYMFAFA